MKTSITSVYQRGVGIVWAVQAPNRVIFTKEGTLDAAKKLQKDLKSA
jgi:hypothetical protein